MTRVDFYVLQEQALIARYHFCCRLAEKAVNHGHHIVIAVDDADQATTLSEYLWSFKPESYLPHHLQTESDTSPIILVWEEVEDQHHDLLINLRDTVPEGFSRFERVFEVVVQEESCLTSTRNHFQFYRDRGYPLKSHSF